MSSYILSSWDSEHELIGVFATLEEAVRYAEDHSPSMIGYNLCVETWDGPLCLEVWYSKWSDKTMPVADRIRWSRFYVSDEKSVPEFFELDDPGCVHLVSDRESGEAVVLRMSSQDARAALTKVCHEFSAISSRGTESVVLDVDKVEDGKVTEHFTARLDGLELVVS